MTDAAVHEYEDVSVGAAASFEVCMTTDLIDAFARLSGDHNPLHTDETFAQHTTFGSRVGHGMIVGAWFSRLVGMHLPGRHALYLSQTLTFHAPMLPGTVLCIRGDVTQKVDALRVLKIRTTATASADGVLHVSGEALVRVQHTV